MLMHVTSILDTDNTPHVHLEIQVFYQGHCWSHSFLHETSLSYQIIDSAGMATCKPMCTHFLPQSNSQNIMNRPFTIPEFTTRLCVPYNTWQQPTCLDITFAINKVCQFIHIGLWYILRYLKHRTHLGLLDLLEFLSATIHAHFQNVDWAGYVVDSCSVGGYAIFLGSSKKQRMINYSLVHKIWRL